MSSTHYMDLLMQNSPWNLILFMAIPVVLAETIAITELLIPLLSQRAELTKKVNRVCGVLAGIAFIGIILYLVPAGGHPDDSAGAAQLEVALGDADNNLDRLFVQI